MLDSTAAFDASDYVESIMKDSQRPSYEELQVENGNYAQILNPILEVLARTRLSGAQYSVLIFILRKTYGFHKKTDRISLGQVIDGTKLSRTAASEALQRLVDANILKRKTQRSHIGFNKYSETWDVSKLVARKEVRDSSIVESQVPSIVESQNRDSSIVESKIRQSLNQQKITKQNIKTNSLSSLQLDDEKMDGEKTRQAHPDQTDCAQQPLFPDSQPQPTTKPKKQLPPKDDSDLIGMTWDQMSQQQKVRSVFRCYNKQFGTSKRAIGADCELTKLGKDCLKWVKKGYRLKAFKMLFAYADEMGASDNAWTAEVWGEKRRSLSTMLCVKHFEGYIDEAAAHYGINAEDLQS